MRFAILGAGALGSIIAGHLARAGEDVRVITRGHRAQYLHQHGITITGVAAAGLAVPTVDTCYRLIRGIDRCRK